MRLSIACVPYSSHAHLSNLFHKTMCNLWFSKEICLLLLLLHICLLGKANDWQKWLLSFYFMFSYQSVSIRVWERTRVLMSLCFSGTYIDKKCPFTGTVSIRGRILAGTCHSAKMNRTIIVRRNYLHFVKKYQR